MEAGTGGASPKARSGDCRSGHAACTHFPLSGYDRAPGNKEAISRYGDPSTPSGALTTSIVAVVTDVIHAM
jgi:hypothetical protein